MVENKIQEFVDFARLMLGWQALFVTSYDGYYLPDETDINRMKRTIEIDARKNRSDLLVAFGCIDSGLL